MARDATSSNGSMPCGSIGLRELTEFRELLAPLDEFHLLSGGFAEAEAVYEAEDDDALLAELGIDPQAPKASPRSRMSSRARKSEMRPTRSRKASPARISSVSSRCSPKCSGNSIKACAGRGDFKMDAEIKRGEFFILGGQKAYVAEVGKEFVTEQGRRNARLRVIFDNGTESDNLLRSLQRALYKDDAGRRITEPDAGPLFETASKP